MIALAVAVALAFPAKLVPIDECAGDDSFALLRDTLVSAADGEALKALVAPDLRETQGVADDWRRLRMLLRMGFVLDSELYSLEHPFSIKIEQRDGQWMITQFD